jgi:hypothetical protein
MKKLILKIVLCFGLLLVIVASYYVYSFFRLFGQIELGKSFYIVIKEDEVVDYNAVNQEQYSNGSSRMWFDMLRDTEREKLVRYMKENNYQIVPGTYDLRQGFKFKDLLRELKFEEIT